MFFHNIFNSYRIKFSYQYVRKPSDNAALLLPAFVPRYRFVFTSAFLSATDDGYMFCDIVCGALFDGAYWTFLVAQGTA
jgi:hypothetical protein